MQTISALRKSAGQRRPPRACSLLVRLSTGLPAPEGTTLAKVRVKSGQCAFRIDGELRPFETMFYRRHLLPVGEALAGRAILLQKESTTVIPPGCSAFNDAAGNLVLKVAGDVR